MKKIIVPTDFSNAAQKATDVAVTIAKKNLCEIIFLHCYSSIYGDPSIPAETIIEIEKSVTTDLEEKLSQVARSTQEKGVRTSFRLMQKSIAEGINELAKKEGADFAIIGKTGETGLLDKLLGSNAAYLIKRLEIPLMVVPEKVRSIEIDQIYFATQLENEDEEFLGEIMEFGDKLKANIDLIHIQNKREPNIVDDDEILADLKSKMGKKQLPIHIVKSENVKATLLHHTSILPKSALALVTYHRGIIEQILNPSMTKSIVEKSDIITIVYQYK